jgi:hypothetical protein
VPPAASRIKGEVFIGLIVANSSRHCEERSDEAVQFSDELRRAVCHLAVLRTHPVVHNDDA